MVKQQTKKNDLQFFGSSAPWLHWNKRCYIKSSRFVYAPRM